MSAAPRRFADSEIAEVRARTDLAALVARKVQLQRRGGEWWGLCPFHGERTPSFHVRRREGYFHCFGCAAHGDCFSWLMIMDGWSFPAAVRELGIAAGMWSGTAGEAPKPLAPISAPPPKPEVVAREAAEAWERAAALWRSGRDVIGTVAETYLRARLRTVGEIPPTIRFCPAHEFREPDPKDPKGKRKIVLGVFPVMLAAMTTGKGRLVTVHRTYLLPDGSGKAEVPNPKKPGELLSAKKIMGSPGRSAIRLTPASRVMLVGEGIETTWAARRLRPDAGAWAGYSLAHIAGKGEGRGERHPLHPNRRLPDTSPNMDHPGMLLPPEVEEVLLLRDADSKDQHSVDANLERASQRFLRDGRQVSIWSPPDGHDFASWLEERIA